MIKKLIFPPFLALCVGLFGCAPTPSDIPHDASRHWSLKGDFVWTWTYRVEHGCVAWMAKAEWADVQVLVDSQCQGQRDLGYLQGKGLSYFSSTDYLLFRGYWPWSSKMWSDMLEFGDDGMLSGGNIHPCPYSLSQNQIDEMRVVATEALSGIKTDGERRMLNRVVERLTRANGEILFSSQAGCTDQPSNYAERISSDKVNPWNLSRNN